MANSTFKIDPRGETPTISLYGTFGEGDLTPEAFSREWKKLRNPRAVRMDISSPGGSCFAANAIFDIIARSGAVVTVHIDGLAASMASLLAMLGTHIVIGAGAQMMIHNPAATIGGGANDHARGAHLLESIRARMVSVYAKRTGQTEESIAKMMDAETWMDAAAAVHLGFADEIGADLKMAASAFDLTGRGYLHAPAPTSMSELSAAYWGSKGKPMASTPADPDDYSDLVPAPITNAEAFKNFHGRFAGRK